MFLVNSRSHLASAALLAFGRKALQLKGRTFSRSYGTILPSSFTRVLSSALVFSTRPPVSVFSTVFCSSSFSRFSWKRGISLFSVRSRVRPFSTSVLTKYRICLVSPPSCLHRDFQHPASLAFSVPTSLQTKSPGILTWFPSTSPFGYALGADSPCSE